MEVENWRASFEKLGQMLSLLPPHAPPATAHVKVGQLLGETIGQLFRTLNTRGSSHITTSRYTVKRNEATQPHKSVTQMLSQIRKIQYSKSENRPEVWHMPFHASTQGAEAAWSTQRVPGQKKRNKQTKNKREKNRNTLLI